MRYHITLSSLLLLAGAGLVLGPVRPTFGLDSPKAPKVSLKVSPGESRLRLGEGVLLKADLKGREGPVRWEVEGAGMGTISSDGFYQAPSYGSTPATVRVTASADGEPTAKAQALIFLQPVSLEIKPEKVELATGETFHFRAKVEQVGDQRVIWSVEGGEKNGRITESGLFTAPAHFATPGTISVKATSAADPMKSAIATVHITKVEIKVKPVEVTIKHGEARRFEAKVTGTPSTAVEWIVLGEGLGHVSNSGMYATPATMSTPAVVTVLARAVADPSKTATVRVRVEAVQLRTGAGRGKNGKNGKNARRPSPLKRMARGLYRAAAPKVVRLIMPFDPIDFLVKGPNFQGKSGKQYVPLGGAVDLDAAVQNSSNDGVKWEVVGEKHGEITEDGTYYAPPAMATPFLVQVRATSIADPTKTVLHTLHIPPVVVQTQKQAYPCLMDGAIQLQSRVENSENDQVKWSVEGGDAFGTVSDNGLYHPPSVLTTPAVIRVRAASVADPSKYAVIQVNVPGVRLELSPDEAEVR
ncbi:MAG: hypothetical protein K0Q72_4466, partial [Armatimonadetes bacterium]|nr:hypothetical protein [Armatimonadota bacterium]